MSKKNSYDLTNSILLMKTLQVLCTVYGAYRDFEDNTTDTVQLYV